MARDWAGKASNAESAKPVVEWQSSETYDPERHLAYINGKLREVLARKERLAVEAPDLKLEDVLERLRQRREDLLKLIRSKSEERHTPPVPHVFIEQFQARDSSHFSEARLPLGECDYLRRMRERNTPRVQDYHRGTQTGYQPIEDLVSLDLSSSINHNSLCFMGLDTEPLDEHGVFIFAAFLDDDEAFWRDDNPDSVAWGQSVHWKFPVRPFRSIVMCNLALRVQGTCSDLTGDFGEGYHSIALATTEPDGEFLPRPVMCPVDYVMVEFDASGQYDSGEHGFHFEIPVDAYASAGLAVLLITYLRAQDGEVSTFGQWRINDSLDGQVFYTSMTGPFL
jgi:hypothetical protein